VIIFAVKSVKNFYAVGEKIPSAHKNFLAHTHKNFHDFSSRRKAALESERISLTLRGLGGNATNKHRVVGQFR